MAVERRPLSATRAVERLGGLQAQSTPSPYLSLWTRLEGFERDENLEQEQHTLQEVTRAAQRLSRRATSKV